MEKAAAASKNFFEGNTLVKLLGLFIEINTNVSVFYTGSVLTPPSILVQGR